MNIVLEPFMGLDQQDGQVANESVANDVAPERGRQRGIASALGRQIATQAFQPESAADGGLLDVSRWIGFDDCLYRGLGDLGDQVREVTRIGLLQAS